MVDALNTMPSVVTRNQTAMRRRVRWKPKLPRQPNRTSTITTKQRRTQRVIDKIGILQNDVDCYLLMDENGSTLAPIPRGRTSGRGRNKFADGLGASTPGSSEKLPQFSDKTLLLQTRVKPVQENRAKNYVRETTETVLKHPHTIARTCHWSRTEKMHSLSPLPTTWKYGERVSETST